MEKQKISEKVVETIDPEGLALFQKRVVDLCNGDKDKAKVMQEFADLQGDFDFVKDLNEQLAAKYDDLCSSFPFAKELDLLIEAIKKDPYEKKELQKKGNAYRFKKIFK